MMAADGLDGNGLQLEKLRLYFASCFRASSKINIYSSGLIEVMSSFRCSKMLFFIVFHGLSCLPIISEQFRAKFCELPVT